MFLQTYSRFGVAIFLIALISGCSTTGIAELDHKDERVPPAKTVFNPCTWNRSSCMHEGSYEPGERHYAEQEAKRLNRAQIERLRTSSGK